MRLKGVFGIAAFAVAGLAQAGESGLSKMVHEAERLYQAGKYRESADVLKSAYDVEPNPRLLYNIARAYDQAGDLKEAIDYYQRYVGSKEGTDPQLLKRSALAIDRLRALVEKDEAARRQQEADKKRAADEAKAAQERAQAEAAAARKAQEEAEARDRASAEAVASTRRTRRTGAFVAGGVGVAGVAVGTVFGLRANSAFSQFKHAQTTADKDTAASQARTNALVADVGFGVGIAALVTAVIVYPKGGDVAVVPTPNGVALAGTF